jgi:two-component system CAI-1 autoinducer sensor kinase/phosphatase CqsS
MLHLPERYFLKPLVFAIGRGDTGRASLIGRVAHELSRRYTEYHAHAQRKIRSAAIIGVLGFPVFYLTWKYVLPQPFESVPLRTVGTLLCLALALSPWWPGSWRRYVVPISYFTFLYSLPFFFTLMLLFNHSNATWQMSTLAALIYVALLYDLVNAIVVIVIGSLAAVAAYLVATGGEPIPTGYWTTLPILFFALTAVLGLAYSDNIIAREKLKAAASLASQVAHECRTPLTGIRFEAEGCERLIARLPATPLRDRLAASHGRVRQHITAANSVIDLLLTNVAQHHRGTPSAELHKMSVIVSQAIERYGFKPNQRDLVRVDIAEDFSFRGSDLLMIHVLFNLLKNGLRAIEARGDVNNQFSIELRRGAEMNRIIVTDTGEGIPPELLNYLFIPFVSAQRPGVGTGLGLSFCRMIVEGAGGAISCRSKLNVGTSFIIELPAVKPVAEDAVPAAA